MHVGVLHVDCALYGEEHVAEHPGLLIVTAIRAFDCCSRIFPARLQLVFAGQVMTPCRASSAIDSLILIDVTMPAQFDSLNAIRASEKVSDRVIMISSPEDNSSIVQGLQFGANDYITKPLDANVVRARVSTQMALQRAENDRQQTISQLKFTQEMQENFTRDCLARSQRAADQHPHGSVYAARHSARQSRGQQHP